MYGGRYVTARTTVCEVAEDKRQYARTYAFRKKPNACEVEGLWGAVNYLWGTDIERQSHVRNKRHTGEITRTNACKTPGCVGIQTTVKGVGATQMIVFHHLFVHVLLDQKMLHSRSKPGEYDPAASL
jgi:hypothetical protein